MNRLRDLREDSDMTLVEVGKILGLSNQAVSNYELEKRALTPDLINKFCDLYGVTSDYLLGRSNIPQPIMSKMDTRLITAYHAATDEIRFLVDTALAPYDPEEQEKSKAL